jgi:hypothetical protein
LEIFRYTGKLSNQDTITTSVFEQLLATIVAMRRMADSLRKTFESFTVKELREIVESIPQHIKSVTAKLQEQQGIIIRGEGSLKLTPEFLRSLNLKSKKLIEAERALKKGSYIDISLLFIMFLFCLTQFF